VRDVVAVVQAGERVVQRQVARARLDLLQLGDVDLAEQAGGRAGGRILAALDRDVVPAQAVRRVHRGGQAAAAVAPHRVDQMAELARLGKAGAHGRARVDHRGAGGRVAVQRPAAPVVQRDHHGRVVQGLQTAQRGHVGRGYRYSWLRVVVFGGEGGGHQDFALP
jgi:hypothetical protein